MSKNNNCNGQLKRTDMLQNHMATKLWASIDVPKILSSKRCVTICILYGIGELDLFFNLAIAINQIAISGVSRHQIPFTIQKSDGQGVALKAFSMVYGMQILRNFISKFQNCCPT